MVPDTLWKFDSLIISGTLLQCGSFLYSGTLAENDSLFAVVTFSSYVSFRSTYLALSKPFGLLQWLVTITDNGSLTSLS